MAEELIYKVGVEGTNELDKLETSVEKAGESTNKTRLYMSELHNELKKARSDMLKYAKGTEEYNKALERSSRITSQISDTNAKMNTSIKDLGVTTQNVSGALAGFAGGFQVVQATMSLFGVENEETIKTMLKLQQTMSIVQGLTAFAQGINEAKDILAAFRQSNQQVTGELQATSEVLDGVSKSSDNMGDSFKASAKESAVLGSNLAGNTKIADDLSKGLDKIGGDAHIANVKKLSEMTELYEQQLESAQKMLSVFTEGSIEHNGALQMVERAEKNLIETQAELNIALKSGQKATESGIKFTKDGVEVMEDLADSTKKSGKAFSSFAKTIGKSLLTMGAFLIAIWAVTEAISALVKWLSSVPESVKIKIELEEDVQKQLESDYLKAKKFANDLQLLYRKVATENKQADRERLERIREQGKEEMGLTDTQLDNIAEVKDGWFEMFNAYLLKAEYTYRKEALMKKKIDAETRIALERESARLKFDAAKDEDGKVGSYGWTLEELEIKSNNSGLGKWIDETFWVWKDAQQVVDHFREATRIETEELAVINKVIEDTNEKLANVDFGTGEIKGSGGTTPTTTAPGKAPSLQDKRPNAVEDDASIQLLRSRNALTRELSNEEMVIYEENMRLKDEYQSDSDLRYTEYQIRLAQARAKDLENQREYLEESLSKTEQYYKEELENTNNNLIDVNNSHNEELAKLREYNQTKFDIEEKAAALLEERQGLDGKKDAARIKAIDDEIEALNKLYKANNDNIANSQNAIAAYKEEKAAIEEKLKTLDAAPEEIARMKDAITELNLAIAENSRLLVTSLADNIQAMMDNAGRYTQQIGIIFDDLESMSNAQMQTADNRTAKEKNNLELSQAYREADSEQQQQMMYELDLANYESKKRAFEANKKFQMGQVVIQSASNEIDIIKAWLDPKTGGPLSPANIAIAAAATATNIATTVASLKQISSTSLDKPVPPSSSSGSGSGSSNISLSPNKTSLTSKEENLNSMYRSSMEESEDTIVKVSEINDVQKRVKVREKNSSY